MEVVIFGGLALYALMLFSRTDYADKPLAQSEPMEKPYGLPITLALTGVLLLLLLGLSGAAVEGSAYDVVESTGDAELLGMFSLSGIVACIGGLMVVNGVARGLGLLLLLGGIFLNVSITAGAMP